MTEEIKALLKEYYSKGFRYVLMSCDDILFPSSLLLIRLQLTFYFQDLMMRLSIALLQLSENCLMKRLLDE